MRGLIGWLALLSLAWVLSESRRRVPWRIVAGGLIVQIALALLLIGVPLARSAILLLNGAVDALQRATDDGTAFVFGYLGGGALPFAETHPGASFILAFKVLPLVLVISAIGSLLFHWGLMQRITGAFAFVLRRAVGIDGPLALAAAVHIFVGNVEAPLLIRPYLQGLQRGELFAVMSCGMAGIAGTVMVIYATILGPVIPDALGTIITASVISTPAALAVAALMVPFATADVTKPAEPHIKQTLGSLDALVRGTADGMGPLVGITTTLLVAVALVSPGEFGVGAAGRPVAGGVVRPALPPGALADGCAVGGDRRCGIADGHKDGAERVRRLSASGGAATGCVERSVPANSDLRDVRVREFRQCRDHGRRDECDGAGA